MYFVVFVALGRSFLACW